MFKTKDACKLELQTPETMKSFGSTKNKMVDKTKLIDKTKNRQKVPNLDAVEVVLE